MSNLTRQIVVEMNKQVFSCMCSQKGGTKEDACDQKAEKNITHVLFSFIKTKNENELSPETVPSGTHLSSS